jgi:cell division protein FtsA
MEGAVELAEEIFHMPVRLGVPHGVKGLIDVVRNPIYSTGVGLLLYGLKKQAEGFVVSSPSMYDEEPSVSVLEKMKRWFQGNF